MKSEVCIYDLAAGSVEVLLQTDRLVEAPNWTPDGTALLINGDGLLYRVPLADPKFHQVDTGFATALNNDHGISPDGKMLAISDRSKTEGSCIYTLPATGGKPQRVTSEIPSYWHGWSPDGATLAYAARRKDGPFGIFTIPVVGGAETRLTDGFEHTDGPDYTPDGQWIWFNGQRDGKMQLWRMHTDGTELEQMTDDERWNWFPHPAPNGDTVLYLSYEPGTMGHPADKEVELRLMPATGGAPQTLVQLFGGQGTINVPCWAPDSQRFAFVRYARPQSDGV